MSDKERLKELLKSFGVSFEEDEDHYRGNGDNSVELNQNCVGVNTSHGLTASFWFNKQGAFKEVIIWE